MEKFNNILQKIAELQQQHSAKATRADGLRAYFRGVAIDESGRAVLYWLLIDENGDEVGDEFTTGAEV